MSEASRLYWFIGLFVCGVAFGCTQDGGQAEVVAYVAVDRKDSEPILKQFEQQTGIRVLALYDGEAAKTTGLVTRLMAEAKQPRCDVFWNNEFAQTISLAERDLLDPYRSANAESIPAEYRDPDGLWTGIATRARVIVYNTRFVSAEEVPRSLQELTLPKWKGKLAIANPLFGTTRTHIAALYAVWGAEKSEEWLRSLLDNEVRIVDGNAMVKNLVARADPDASPVLIGLTDTDDVLSGQAEGDPIDFVYPDQDDLGTLVIPTTVCVIKNGPHPEETRQLVDYLVGKNVANLLTKPGTGYRPLPANGDAGDESSPRMLSVSYKEIYDQLVPSTEWVTAHFHN